MFWGNLPETQEKGKQKGGNIQSDGQVHTPPRPDPVGEACARIEWALNTNEMSVVKQMPLLGEFSGYSEWGGRKPKGGPKRSIITP